MDQSSGLFAEFQKIFQQDQIETRNHLLEAAGVALDGSIRKPQLILFPLNVQQVKQILEILKKTSKLATFIPVEEIMDMEK